MSIRIAASDLADGSGHPALGAVLWDLGRFNLILGTPDNESLIGTPGRDLILGRGGFDGIYGQAGDDVIIGNGQLVGDAGDDVLIATAPTPQQVVGSQIIAGPGDDLLIGGVLDDQLFGEAGRDTILGGPDNDRIVGGLDPDLMFGGAGHDRFEFTIYPIFGSPGSEPVYLADTGQGLGRRDVIGDFEPGADVLSLAGYGISTFIGMSEFSGDGVGQVRYEIRHGSTIVQFRGTYILSPEIFPAEIELRGIHHLSAADFDLV
ncbi:calcium-binding protein [Paracraurococcus lichenis]|uniref:Calcium-binding protein n=1 Tax=Paracraurococcus lichenis TaxID=3064888 RepID=A0ABT9DU39_9PROT|nr:calcium-binding protein [Paracraurococcus sp. LOR1-02]MDO9707407.1 calcium-binding protein [Paracraurococcus sp. LOR1-02]